MRFERVSAEVFVAPKNVVAVSLDDIAVLKAQALQNPSRKVRLCAHASVDDALHEMLIVHMSGAYIRPHKHPNKSESFHMIEGRLDIALFSDEGKLERIIPLAAGDGSGCLYYRLSESRYHTVVPRSEVVVFHEVTNGPFDRRDTIFAPWSPEETDAQGIDRFLLALHRDIETRGAGAQ